MKSLQDGKIANKKAINNYNFQMRCKMDRMIPVMDKLIVVFVVLLFSMKIFGAPSLQERANAELGRPDTTTATFVEKTGQAIKQLARDCVNETIAPTDTFISNHATVTASQLQEWALRALRGSMHTYMIPMIMDDSRLAGTITSSTDNQIKNATKACLWPWVKLIGTGSF